MKVGVPKEIKVHEYRVGLIPASVKELTRRGHAVLIETQAGEALGFTDAMYQEVGATIVPSAADVFAQAELIIKVKEPQQSEYAYFKPHHSLFTFLHLAAVPELAKALKASGCLAIAYETVTDHSYRLPLLAPMSEVAGRIAVQEGARCLTRIGGGKGLLLGGIPGILPAKVVVIGAGMAGLQAASAAQGMGAEVTLLDKSIPQLKHAAEVLQGNVKTRFSTLTTVSEELATADLVIGAVLVPGDAAPKVVTKEHINAMQPRSVIVDISIDQGGCFETSKPTNFEEPTFMVDDVVHYCVTNLPSAVPLTSAIALNNVTLPYILAFAEKGVAEACAEDPHLRNGVNVYQGQLCHAQVAKALGDTHQPMLEDSNKVA